MNRNVPPEKIGLLARIGGQYAGAIAPVALSATSAWLIVSGIKGLAGFTMNRQTALADLLGIVLVVGVARWLQRRTNAK
ncbi:MAG: hypothetical protein NVSMB6_21880 [Burkholderiaceae bacterium]